MAYVVGSRDELKPGANIAINAATRSADGSLEATASMSAAATCCRIEVQGVAATAVRSLSPLAGRGSG